MDRPALRGNLTLPDPNLGVYAFEASRAAALQAQVNTSLAALGAGFTFPVSVRSWDVSGGGGGSAWRLAFDCCLDPGWGLNTSPPILLTRVVCREVKHATQLRAAAQALLLTLAEDCYIWGVKYASSGRDGTYLVAILYSTDGGQATGRMTYSAQATAEQGPYAVATLVTDIEIPLPAQASPYTVREYICHYAMTVQDNSGGAGVKATLKLNSAVIHEQQWIAAGDWIGFSGVYKFSQEVASTQLLELFVEPLAVTVSVRGVSLNAVLINSSGAEG